MLLVLVVPSSVCADDPCQLERTYRNQWESMRREYDQRAGRIEGLNATIDQLRSQEPLAEENLPLQTQLREQLRSCLDERRVIYTDLRLMKDRLKRTSRRVAQAHKQCLRSKRRGESPPRTRADTPSSITPSPE